MAIKSGEAVVTISVRAVGSLDRVVLNSPQFLQGRPGGNPPAQVRAEGPTAQLQGIGTRGQGLEINSVAEDRLGS